LPKEWVRRHRSDYYYKKAKKENYRSRAAFKLLEVIEKYHFVKQGDFVVDLGAAPGGWMQVIRQVVGEKGFVLGVDINEIEAFEYSNVNSLKGDIKILEISKKIKESLGRRANVVVADVSPQVSGIWEVDHARQIDLAECSLILAKSILYVRGNFFVKTFQGDMFNQFVKKIEYSFSKIKIIKPKASRKKSSEIYILGLNLKDINRNIFF
jgi:23S rRNA (uridine2552-2'-O)-methyltransferase